MTDTERKAGMMMLPLESRYVDVLEQFLLVHRVAQESAMGVPAQILDIADAANSLLHDYGKGQWPTKPYVFRKHLEEAHSDLKAALEEGAAALLALLDAVRKEPAMAKRDYVQLGIQCTDAAKKMSAALSGGGHA